MQSFILLSLAFYYTYSLFIFVVDGISAGGGGGGGGGGVPERGLQIRTEYTLRHYQNMSDRLKDLELELHDIIVALKDIAGTQ